MFRSLLHTTALVSLSLCVAASALADSYRIDPAKSTLAWEGTKAIGGGHNGTISIKSGEVEYEGAVPKRAEVVVDMASIVDLDLESPKWNAKLVGHLKSDDFFGTAEHPEAKLVISEFKKDAKGYALSGTLTVKGQTRPVKLRGEDMSGGPVRKVRAKLVFDRTEFGIRYRSGSFFDGLGDKVISDDITIEAELALVK